MTPGCDDYDTVATPQSVERAALAELRMNCCSTPEPTIERDSDDPKVWEIVCESCDETLAYILAPEDDGAGAGCDER